MHSEPPLHQDAIAARTALVSWMRSQLAADAQPKALAYALATLAVDVLLTTQQQTVKRTLMILARTSDGGRDF